MQESEWKAVADKFEERWNFPNCIGTIDGKYIVMKYPNNLGSYFFNYKTTFSIVVLSLVNADFKFIFIDVSCNGIISDGGVFYNSPFSKALLENTIGIPNARYVEPGRELTYVIVADDAFPLKNHIMKSYVLRNLKIRHERVFVYQLSRARRIVENAFGILASRFSRFRDSDAAFS